MKRYRLPLNSLKICSMGRYMALDVGDRRIGVALSDPMQILASPLQTIMRTSDEYALLEISNLVNKHGVDKLIIGMPYSLDGTVGPQAEQVLSLKDKITALIGIDVVLRDEKLSSVTVHDKLGAGKRFARLQKKIEAAATPGMQVRLRAERSRLKEKIDAAAATVILQSYLDQSKPGKEESGPDNATFDEEEKTL
jgi:putative Holliday junction resolvase